MLTKRETGILFILSIIPFIIYALIRPDLAGQDTYYFISHMCHGTPIVHQPELVYFIFSIIPCNFLVFKAILWFLFFFSLLSIAMLGKVFFPEHGYWAAILAMCSPLLLLEFLKLENDQFAFPIIFFAIFLFFYKKNEKNPEISQKNQKFFDFFKKNQIFSLILLFLVAFFIWNGAYIVLVALLISQVFGFVAVGWIGIFFFEKFYTRFSIQDLTVAENMPLHAISYWFAASAGIWGLPRKMWLPAGIILVSALVYLKFAVLALPFLAVGLLFLTDEFPKSRYLFIGVALAFLLAFPFTFTTQPPTLAQWDVVDYLKDLNEPFENQWSYGYWVMYKGLETDRFGGKQITEPDYNGISLTYVDLNCPILKEEGLMKLFDCRSDKVKIR